MIIAIDGPAGAGKTTVSERVAQQLGIIRLDTGALYRVAALAATRANLTPASPGLDRFVAELEITFIDGRAHLNGEDVSGLIRTPQISEHASAFSAVPAIRAGLLDLQRNIGRRESAVVDGRQVDPCDVVAVERMHSLGC